MKIGWPGRGDDAIQVLGPLIWKLYASMLERRWTAMTAASVRNVALLVTVYPVVWPMMVLWTTRQ